MDNKDNRSKDKRHKMKTHFRNKSKCCSNNNNNNASSSSAQMESNMRGIVDIVDSSDEHFLGRTKWCHGKMNTGRVSILEDGGRCISGESEESLCDSRLSTGGSSTTSTSYNLKKQQRQHQQKQKQSQKHSEGRSIQSNSSHQIYSPIMADMLDEIDENEQLNAGDFKLLSQYPTTMSRHFTFASEKQWEAAEKENYFNESEGNEYFTLNLQLLSAGLKTIPFYKRMDYSADLFTEEQLNIMENEAELAEKSYQDILQKHLDKARNKRNAVNDASNANDPDESPKANQVINKNNNVKEDVLDDELEELLQMTTSQMVKVDLKTSPEQNQNDSILNDGDDDGDNNDAVAIMNNVAEIHNTTDIQDWLDTVLEE